MNNSKGGKRQQKNHNKFLSNVRSKDHKITGNQSGLVKAFIFERKTKRNKK